MFIEHAPWEAARLDQFGPVGVVNWFQAWETPFDGSLLASVAKRGAVPMVTWEPWNPAQRDDKVLERTLRGDFDRHVASWADGLRQFGGEVWLRLAHEMNGTWYPWGKADPTLYVAFWRYVRRQVVRRGRAANARFVWCPNVVGPTTTSLDRRWPGAAHVDLVGVDGYNWGVPWLTPREVLAPTLALLRPYGKPLLVAETACPADERRAAWVRGLRDLSGLEAVCWFNADKERDWRLTPSEAAIFRDLARG